MKTLWMVLAGTSLLSSCVLLGPHPEKVDSCQPLLAWQSFPPTARRDADPVLRRIDRVSYFYSRSSAGF